MPSKYLDCWYGFLGLSSRLGQILKSRLLSQKNQIRESSLNKDYGQYQDTQITLDKSPYGLEQLYLHFPAFKVGNTWR